MYKQIFSYKHSMDYLNDGVFNSQLKILNNLNTYSQYDIITYRYINLLFGMNSPGVLSRHGGSPSLKHTNKTLYNLNSYGKRKELR